MTYYDEISKGYDNLHREEQLKKMRLIAKSVKVLPSDRLLDVGCGSGISTIYFKCEATGIDSSNELIKLARNYKYARFLVGRAENLPFPDKTFDIVISITAIHNFTDINKALGEMKRVGKNRYVISVLKKCKDFEAIESKIKKRFKIQDILEDEKDRIFIGE